MTLRVVSPAGTREAMIEEAVLRALAYYPFKVTTLSLRRDVLKHLSDCGHCLKYRMADKVRMHFNAIRLERSTFQTHQLIRDNVAHFQPNRLGLRLV